MRSLWILNEGDNRFDVLRRVLLCIPMEKTITVRLDREQDEALTHRARVTGKTRSAVVRELLSKALSDQSIDERAGHLKGSLRLKGNSSSWGKHLKKQNWR